VALWNYDGFDCGEVDSVIFYMVVLERDRERIKKRGKKRKSEVKQKEIRSALKH